MEPTSNKQSSEHAKQFNYATFPWLEAYFLAVAQLFSIQVDKLGASAYLFRRFPTICGKQI